jgi:hypothetical protein
MPVFPVRKAMERMPAAGGGGTDIRRRARDTADRSLLASSTSDRAHPRRLLVRMWHR